MRNAIASPSIRQAPRSLPSRFPRRRHITRAFVPVQAGYLETIPVLQLRAAFLAIYEHGQGDTCEMEHRVLAAKLGRSMKQVARYVLALQLGGWLGVERRKKSRCRNHPNRYSFPGLRGFIVDSDGEEKQDRDLKNITAPPARRPTNADEEVGRLKRQHYERTARILATLKTEREAMSRKTKAHHEAFAVVFAQMRSLSAVLKSREWKREQEIRRRQEASVGMHRPTQSEIRAEWDARIATVKAKMAKLIPADVAAEVAEYHAWLNE